MLRSIFIIVAASVITHGGFARTPAWVKEFRKVQLPGEILAENPDAVVLSSRRSTTIMSNGVFRSRISGAVLARNIDGFAAAYFSLPYYSDTEKIVSFNAWVLPKKGKEITYKKTDFTDSISFNYKNVATTARYRSIHARSDMKIGSIFVYEAVVENRDIFSQETWVYQSKFPTLDTSFSIEHGKNWQIEPVFFNMDSIEPDVATGKRSTTVKTWKLGNVPSIAFQPFSPSAKELVKWAAFNIIPPESSGRRLYRSWKEISTYRTPTYDSLSVVSPEMEAKVEELTANSAGQMETIRTLSELAQSINYISVALNLGKGGGYTPRPADEVFETKYGDCKDKTNLLQGLLKVKGIDLYPLIVYSGQTKIFENWPSQSQFNHCVAAIKVDDSLSSDVTIKHPELGRLLIFDPTSTFTPFGDLPYSIQGSKGIILAGDQGGLVSIPQLPLEKSLLKRDIEMELLRDGRAIGRILESSTGQAGKRERQIAFKKDSDYAQMTKNWIAGYHPGAVIGEPKRTDDKSTGNFSLEVEFATPSFAKNMRNILLIFKPVVLNRITHHPFGDEQRTQPVDLNAYNLEENTLIYLPEGFEISEIPEDVQLQESFGSYNLSFELGDNSIAVSRSIKINPDRITVENFPVLEAFYKNRIKADQSSVVLERS